MIAHGLGADIQRLRNRPRSMALSQQSEHLSLSRRQETQRTIATPLAIVLDDLRESTDASFELDELLGLLCDRGLVDQQRRMLAVTKDACESSHRSQPVHRIGEVDPQPARWSPAMTIDANPDPPTGPPAKRHPGHPPLQTPSRASDLLSGRVARAPNTSVGFRHFGTRHGWW
jgi:hypothetical protein